MKTDDAIEIIELLDDDADLFSGRAPAQTLRDSGGPNWVGPVAALVLVGLIGYGVVSSSSSGGTPKVEPVTSTTVVSPTTQPTLTSTSTETSPPPLVPYYAADPPREFKVQYAEIVDSPYRAPDFELWATPGSAGTSGSWFSLMRIRGTQTIYADNAYRLQTERETLAISRSRPGQTTVQVSNNRSSSAVLTAVGWSTEDLVRLAESVDFDSIDAPFSDTTLLAGYQKITTVQPWLAVQGLAKEQVYYTAATDPYGGFGITVAPVEPGIARGGLGMDRQTALRFLLDHETPFTVDGHPGVAGTWLDQSDYSLATWTAGDHIVTVSGQMPVPQLIAIARTVHQVSPTEWDGMKFQVAKNNSEANTYYANVSQQPPAPVSFGTDANGDPWTIAVAVITYGYSREISWLLGRSSDMSIPNDSAQINTYVDNTRSYVLADLPRDVAGAELRVSRGGLDPMIVSFNDIDPTLDRTFAAFAFTETGPYTAQIVTPDGTVLASWPSS